MDRAKYSAFLLCALVAPLSVQATDISLGINGAMETTPYHAKHHNYTLLPVFNYDDDTWYIQGAEAGYYVLNSDVNELKIKAYYLDNDYKNKDAKTAAMRELNNRRGTMMVGASYQYTTAFGAIHSQLAVDTLDHSQGVVGNLSYLNMLTFKPLTLIPELGVDWANGQQNRYYFGISDAESQRSGLAEYRPHASFTPYVAATLAYAINPHWDAYFSARHNWLGSTVKDSPMVARGQTMSLAVGINYDF